MKIAQVCHVSYPHIGGVETHVQKISEHLKDFEIEIICTGNKGVFYHNGIKIVQFPSLSYHDRFFFAPQIYFYLKKNNFDIIHGHDMQSFPSWFASKVNTNFLFTPHYHGITNFGKSRIDKASHIFYHSEHERQLLSKFNIPPEKLVKITNGLDPEEFKGTVEKIPNRIIYTGRLEQYKNIQILIQAMSFLRDYTLEIVGRGPYEQELKKMVINRNLSDNITFIPYLDRQEYLKHIKQAECFVNLSSKETYSISTTEALASGTYCVVNKNTGMSDFVGNDCDGLENIEPISVMEAILYRKSIEPRKWQTCEEAVQIYKEIYNKLT